jgi:hypothetical protein
MYSSFALGFWEREPTIGGPRPLVEPQPAITLPIHRLAVECGRLPSAFLGDYNPAASASSASHAYLRQ